MGRRPVGGLAPVPGTVDPTSLCTSQPLSLASSSWATQVRGISGEEMRFAVNLLEIASLDQLSTNLHSDPLGGSAPSSVLPPNHPHPQPLSTILRGFWARCHPLLERKVPGYTTSPTFQREVSAGLGRLASFPGSIFTCCLSPADPSQTGPAAAKRPESYQGSSRSQLPTSHKQQPHVPLCWPYLGAFQNPIT